MRSVSSDRAYDYIRKQILSGGFPPGHSLLTEELSSDIGLSRTPIRDALRQLEADGLVTIKARLGASVTTLDLKGYREICGLRLALESYAAGLAATNRTEPELLEISQALDAMRKTTKQLATAPKEDALMDELVKEDVRFHIAILSAAKNDLLKKEILRLHLINRVVSGKPPGQAEAKITKADRQARRQLVMRMHETIFEAIDRGDGTAAKAAMEAHIQDIIDSNIRIMGLAKPEATTRELTEDELNYST